VYDGERRCGSSVVWGVCEVQQGEGSSCLEGGSDVGQARRQFGVGQGTSQMESSISLRGVQSALQHDTDQQQLIAYVKGDRRALEIPRGFVRLDCRDLPMALLLD